MKIIAVFITLFAFSLAAPSEVSTTEEKSVVPEKNEDAEKLVQKDATAEESSDSSNVETVLDKDEPAPSKGTASPEEKPPVVVVATSVEKEKTDEVKWTGFDDEEFKMYAKKCRASTGATQEQIEAVGKKTGDDVPQAVKCYIRCMSEAYGLIKDDVVQKDVILQQRPSEQPAEKYEMAVNICSKLKADDPCESAYLRYICHYETIGAPVELH